MARSAEEWDKDIHAVVANLLKPVQPAAHPTAIHNIDNLASFIDHTLLKPDASSADVAKLCQEAKLHKFKSCCVNGSHISQVARLLGGSQSIPCVVVGFPLGAGKSSAKAFEAQEAISDGAKEIDMVINIGALKARDYVTVFEDIHAVVSSSSNLPVKVILETFLLSDDEKVAGAFISAEAGAAFVKTSTGFGGGGASVEDVTLMKRTVSYKDGAVKVKASGGVRTFEKCMEMLHAGADRIGTSSGATILAEAKVSSALY